MKVYIWGTGMISSQYSIYNEIPHESLLGYIETQRTKIIFNSKQVYQPEEIANTDFDYIIVCVSTGMQDIIKRCTECNIPTEKLILVNNWEWTNHLPITHRPPVCCIEILPQPSKEFLLENFPILYKEFILEKNNRANNYVVVNKNRRDLIENNLFQSESYQTLDYQSDYFRYRTFELVADEIINSNISGCIAEVGVYKGGFAKLLNQKFNDRTLYLFDTFESFDTKEFESEVQLGRAPSSFWSKFTITNEDYVLKQMFYPEKCIIRKGFFPKTAIGLENVTYAFVSIDVDLEQSILESLRYFYPRLNEGGVIFIHDYNNSFLEGVKIAVSSYQNEIKTPLKKIPLADKGGTLVLIK